MKTLEFILNENSRSGFLSQKTNLAWRMLYMLFSSSAAAILLYAFALPFLQYFNLNTSFALAFTEVNAQLIFQGTLIYLVNKYKVSDYLISMVTISLIGGLLFIPILVLQFFIGALHPYFLLCWFGAVVLTMFILHLKACRQLGLGYTMSISWVLYRFIVLYFTFL